jgi:hypothetical protein
MKEKTGLPKYNDPSNINDTEQRGLDLPSGSVHGSVIVSGSVTLTTLQPGIIPPTSSDNSGRYGYSTYGRCAYGTGTEQKGIYGFDNYGTSAYW